MGDIKKKKKKKKQQKKKKDRSAVSSTQSIHRAATTKGTAIPPKKMPQQSNVTLQSIVSKKAPGWEHAVQILNARSQKNNTALQL